MDWLSPLAGLVGVMIGGGIGLRGSKTLLDRQLADAQQAREEAERIAVVAAVSKVLTMLLEKAEQVPDDRFASGISRGDREEVQQQLAAEKAWEQQWRQVLQATRLAALEVRHEALRDLLRDGTNHMQSLYIMDYALHGQDRRWVLRNAVISLIECVYAWRRGDDLPPANSCLNGIRESYEQRAEEYETQAQAEEEHQEQERQRRAASDEDGISGPT